MSEATSDLLTPDDLDALGFDAMDADDPRPIRDRLLDIAAAERVSDPGDVAYALALAADITARVGDHHEALALMGRAVEAAEARHDDGYRNVLRANRADLLLRSGHDDEGMRELAALRPRLTRDTLATSYVIDGLTENGRAELAEQWLTSALTTALDAAERADEEARDSREAWEIVDALAGRRRAVRRDLDLPPDEHDTLTDELDAAEAGMPDLVFWPRVAFESLVERRPELTTLTDDGSPRTTWDEHRADVERELAQAHGEGVVLVVEVATPQLLAHLVGAADAGPLEEVPPGPVLEWPPGRNAPCWCGAGAKYKKCCLPRGRG